MKKNLGFTRFEFYFVISVIGVVTLIAIQRYSALAEETRRLSFEIIAGNFSAVIYNHHARWIISQQNQSELSSLLIDGVDVEFSPSGWPMSASAKKNIVNGISITSCLSLWQHFLQDAPLISFVGGDAYGMQTYHLSMPDPQTCRYEFVRSQPSLYIDYEPASGKLVFHKLPLISK